MILFKYNTFKHALWLVKRDRVKGSYGNAIWLQTVERRFSQWAGPRSLVFSSHTRHQSGKSWLVVGPMTLWALIVGKVSDLVAYVGGSWLLRLAKMFHSYLLVAFFWGLANFSGLINFCPCPDLQPDSSLSMFKNYGNFSSRGNEHLTELSFKKCIGKKCNWWRITFIIMS